MREQPKEKREILEGYTRAEKINRIIYWQNELKDVQDFEKDICDFNFNGDNTIRKDNILNKIRIKCFRGKSRESMSREILIPETVFLEFLNYLSEYKTHLKGLIESQDVDLIDIATNIREGKINSKGE